MDAQTQATEIGARWFEVSALTEGKVDFLMNKILRDLLDRNMPVALEKEGSQSINESEEQEEVLVVAEEEKPLGFFQKFIKIKF